MGQTVELMDRITVNPDQCGGRPCVRGMRIRVIDVLDLLAAGLSAEQVIEELPDLQRADVTACLRFASRRLDHPVLAAEHEPGAVVVVRTDAHLSPALAPWLRAAFGVEAVPLRALGLRDAEDPTIFTAARATGAVLMTKDSDFVELLARHGPPPQVVWLTCGNTTNAALRRILAGAWPRVAELLGAGEPLVEITGSAI